MNKTYIIIFAFISCLSSVAQETLDAILQKYNQATIPYIHVEELHKTHEDLILLDAREKVEYDVSHIQNAIYVGYEQFQMQHITSQNIDKSKKIVVYCSLGVRSEDISEKLKKAGYKNVYNLYGGIFEWKNNDLPVVNPKNKKTEEVHVYSKEWSKWLRKGKKIY